MLAVCCMLVLAGPWGWDDYSQFEYPRRPPYYVIVDTEQLLDPPSHATEKKNREQRAVELRNDRWLSKREKGTKIIELLGRKAPRRSYRGLVDRKRVVVWWNGTRGLCRSTLVGEGGYGCVVFRSVELSVEEAIEVWLLPASPPMSPADNPFFAPTLKQSLAVSFDLANCDNPGRK